jgi:hypothetical protein
MEDRMARGQSDADFERVNALVAGGMKKMQAIRFRRRGARGVCERREGQLLQRLPSGQLLVAEAFSRAAGQRRPAKRRPPRSAPGAVASNGAASIDDLAARLVANIQALATAVGEQNRELTELRDRVDRARDALR